MKRSKPKLVRGSGRPRKPPAAKAPVKPLVSVPRAPSWLSAPAKAEWRRCAALLTTRKVLSEGDLAALETFCSAKGRLVEASRLLAAEGLVIDGANDTKVKHPAISIASEASALIKSLGAALGLTPASRRRAAPDDTKGADSAWEGLLDE